MERNELLGVKGVGPVTLEKLNYLGIYSRRGIVEKTPVDYIDLDAVSDLDEAEDGQFVVLVTEITSASKPFRKGKLQMYRVTGATDDGKKVKLVWYNANYVASVVCAGAKVRVYGKLRKEGRTFELINPAYEKADALGEGELRGIKPVYATRGVIPQKTFSAMVADVIAKGFDARGLADGEKGLMNLGEAFVKAHFPSSLSEAGEARERIELEKLLKDILAYRTVRRESRRAIYYEAHPAVIDKVTDALPYRLTQSQKAAVNDILERMQSDKPLNAMLVGDVGSGKTVVAMIAAYYAAASGHQAAVMAPTEILAVQHYRTFEKFLAPLGVKVVLLTGGCGASEKRVARSAVSSGYADIVIGTHAVISKGVDFRSLSLVVIDEQHRFGVAQRTALVDKGGAVDTLTLSATPIPRSLRLTVFGDVDVMSIDRRYSADNVSTAVVTPAKRKGMTDYIVEECLKGKQAYVVAPKIFDAEGIEGFAAEKLYKELCSQYGDKVTIGLLHGRMKAQEKQKVLNGFAEGKVSVLVSTTVIEVGIDVPNASLMAIFDADRFGLSTLHQLRGRIGRDGSKAYCFLYTTKSGDDIVRLETLVRERDGLEIAEKDLEMRGAGEWLGEEQSGKGGASLSLALMRKAKDIADRTDVAPYKNELTAYALARGFVKISLN